MCTDARFAFRCYYILSSCGAASSVCTVNHVRRMAIGMGLAGFSFVICAVLQLYIDAEPPETVNVVWQFPQYVVVTSAEILVSITSLEFAYAEVRAQRER